MPQLVTHEAEFSARNRLVAIRLASLTLRLRASWSELFGGADAAAIMLAIAVIRSEKLLREEVSAAGMSLSVHLPHEALGPCNISSIAHASGFNRETARRKVSELLKSGLLVREANEIRFAPGFTQTEAFSSMIGTLLDHIRGTMDELLNEGVLRVRH